MIENIFQRTELLLGKEVLESLSNKRIILFGVGGVGSWCAESLIRTGVRHLTIVDFDKVCLTNINRQLPATTETIGEFKTSVLKKRLLSINPEAEITEITNKYDPESADTFQLETYDYIIDAIDSLDCKTHLILSATQTRAHFFSSMGAASKLDPTRVQVAEFWKVKGCPLAAAVRRKIKKNGTFPSKKFRCIFSDELITGERKGTVAHVTAVFGFVLASLVIKEEILNFEF